jgi:hypothetical protein
MGLGCNWAHRRPIGGDGSAGAVAGERRRRSSGVAAVATWIPARFGVEWIKMLWCEILGVLGKRLMGSTASGCSRGRISTGRLQWLSWRRRPARGEGGHSLNRWVHRGRGVRVRQGKDPLPAWAQRGQVWVDDAEWWHHGWPPVMSYHIASSISAVLKLWTFYLSCHEPWFVIIKHLRVNLDLSCVMHSRLEFVWVLMYTFRSYKCDPSDLPGFDPATVNEMILYYRLMTKWSGLGDTTKLSRMRLSHPSLSSSCCRSSKGDKSIWTYIMIRSTLDME